MVSIGKMKSGGMKARRSHRGLKPKSRPTASQIPKKVSLRRKRLVVSCSIFFRLSCLAAGIPRLCPDRCKHRRKGRAKFFHAWFSGVFRSEEHHSELQSLMRISYAVFCLKKKNNTHKHINN